MRRPIQDEFANLPISRQRKYQLRQKRLGRCVKCGEPAEGTTLCPRHQVMQREYLREKLGLKRRYYNSPSYRAGLESDPAGARPHPDLVKMEAAVPKDHPLRQIKARVNRLLGDLASGFDEQRRVSPDSALPPEQLLKSWVLITLYAVPSPRQFCESLPLNPPWLWFLDLRTDTPPFEPDVFDPQYRSLMASVPARRFRERLFGYPAGTRQTRHAPIDLTQASLGSQRSPLVSPRQQAAA